MSKITTLSIGGPAKDFKVIHTEQELIDLVKKNPDFLIIGGGSNLLVSDEGVDKLVIKNDIIGISTSKAIHPRGEKMRLHLGGGISVKSGTLLQDLVDYSIAHGFSGLQKLTGIPGTVGGAVFGNAGAYGQTISDHILEIKTLNSVLTKKECKFSYRDSIFKKNEQAPSFGSKSIILEVTFQLENAEPAELKKEAEAVLAKRLIKYPPGIKCPGFFQKHNRRNSSKRNTGKNFG